MEPFSIKLQNGSTLTGIHSIPPQTSGPRYKPLIVALHGGTYNASYFDADEKHTAKTQSQALGVPFVAINRPSYGGSTSLYPLPTGVSFHEVLGDLLHKQILPALWATYGVPAGCSALILLPHSLGTPGVVVAAAHHAADPASASSYPLAGAVISGFGTILANSEYRPAPAVEGFVRMVPSIKDAVMLPAGTVDPGVHDQSERLNEPMPWEEIAHVIPGVLQDAPPELVWLASWRDRWAPKVKVPLMLAVAEKDALWNGSEEHLRDWMSCFTASERVDGSVLKGAPHCIELSYWASGWYARCFGFALECAASSGTAKARGAAAA